ncbi:MAG: sterol desaturase family protein [Flavobacteriales bacterium]|nr:sterol desaturase family protein [Flavobacteriales bacterium]
MKKVASLYFSHPSVWTYIFIGCIVGYFAFSQGFMANHWYVMFAPVLIAPFFEWFAHKYILHMQIGNVVELDAQENVKKGDKLTIEIHGEQKEVEVLSINDGKMEVGYGWAKNLKAFRKFMHVLHYGHHENPNDVPLIFAPILSVIILFASMFGLSLLVTFNLSIATVFLFSVIIYYLHYEWMHLGHHVPGYQHIFPWSNKLKTAHQLHHYRNENYWWGITNNIGDKILGTYKSHKDVPMSKTIKHINHQ